MVVTRYNVAALYSLVEEIAAIIFRVFLAQTILPFGSHQISRPAGSYRVSDYTSYKACESLILARQLTQFSYGGVFSLPPCRGYCPQQSLEIDGQD